MDRDRSIKTLSGIKYLLSSLKGAEKVVIFPEGTYVREEVGAGKKRLIEMILGAQSDLPAPNPVHPDGHSIWKKSGMEEARGNTDRFSPVCGGKDGCESPDPPDHG